MDFGIDKKQALVCASSKGLGKAIALSLAREGARIFMCARHEEELLQAVSEVESVSRHPVHSAACDLSDPHQREDLIREVRSVFPNLSILIHNVGGPPPSQVETTTAEAWEKGFQQLFQSIIHLNQAFLPGMKTQKWGRIVAVTSISVFEPIADLAVSNGLRPGITAMLKTLADEVAGKGVTVNCVAPGMIHTDRTEERLRDYLERHPEANRKDWLASCEKSIPAGRLGTPAEFAAAVAFLCSEPAAYITGSTLSVDGGRRRSHH